jgi:F-type H+-transporting ATPase subunit b
MLDKLGALGLNIPLFVAQVINFLLLLLLLYLFAYKPILRMFDERSRRIKESMDMTESVREQAANAEEAARKRIEEASHEGQEMIARAIKTGEDIKQKAEQDARPEAEALVERARQDIQRERDEAIAELRKEFTDLTISAAEKIIEKELDKEAHRELIDKVLEESEILKKN